MRKLSCHQSHGSREVRRNGRKDARKENERGAAKERYILLSDFVCILIFYVYFTQNASLLLRILSRSSTLLMPMSWRKWSQGHYDEGGRTWSKVFSSWLVSVLLHPPERVYQMCNWVTNLLRFASFSFCSFHSIRYGELQGLRNYTHTHLQFPWSVLGTTTPSDVRFLLLSHSYLLLRLVSRRYNLTSNDRKWKWKWKMHQAA